MEPKKQPNERTCNWNKWPDPCTDNLWIGHETIHCVIVVVTVCPHQGCEVAVFSICTLISYYQVCLKYVVNYT